MDPVQDTYPEFEANQVLSSRSLNQVFAYLDEGERLTRANLIGTGICCGLTLSLDAATTSLHLAPGCGVTTEGYLAIEAGPVTLTAYREYRLPPELDYPLLRDKVREGKPPYLMWELFPAGEADTVPLAEPVGFLDDKVAMLVVELKKESLRNCSPNDCNDLGAQVVVAVRRLLVDVKDADRIIAEGNALSAGMSLPDMQAAVADRLALPDLRMPRLDVPATQLATTEHLLAAFHALFHDNQLAHHTGKALQAAYDAFRPLLQQAYPDDPFASFDVMFGFLDDGYGDAAQVAFLPYYADLFDHLLQAYDEMRWAGVEQLCACVPTGAQFPRHLLLGIPRAVKAEPSRYRSNFVPACAVGGQHDEFLQRFQRLVAMVRDFTHQPATMGGDQRIGITPGWLGPMPMEERPLPYYFRLDGIPAIQKLWSPTRSRRQRSHHILGYCSAEFSPQPPAFVTSPLRFDLAPRDFLRIEGHLGMPGQQALRELLTLRNRHRLPIEIVLVRTGSFADDDAASGDDAASFPDLEALYDVWRESILDRLCENIRFLYGIPAGTDLPGGRPAHPLLRLRMPQLAFSGSTVGSWFERNLSTLLSRAYIDIDQGRMDAAAVQKVYAAITSASSIPLFEPYHPYVASLYYMTLLAQALPDSLGALAYADVENKCQDLLALTRYLRDERFRQMDAPGNDLGRFVHEEDLIDRFDQLLYGCNPEALRALHDAVATRTRDLRQFQLLAYFLRRHPGIQHKAGVPLGGTFVLVSHDLPQADNGLGKGSRPGRLDIEALRPLIGSAAIRQALKRIGSNAELARDPDVQLVIGSLAGAAAPTATAPTGPLAEAVRTLRHGTVIADFFLPYRLGADGGGVQYVLPPEPLGLTVQPGCTDDAGNAQVTLKPEGGMPPVSYQLDGNPYQPLTAPVLMTVGEHVVRIRDSAGAESAPQTVTVPTALQFGEPLFLDDRTAGTYRVQLAVTGGVRPYLTDSGQLDINTYTSNPVPGGEPLWVEIRDSAGCSIGHQFLHEVPKPCDLPCEGVARRCGFHFWLPPISPGQPYTGYGVEVPEFSFEFRDGKLVTLQQEVQQLLASVSLDDLNGNQDKVADAWARGINRLIADAIGNDDWLVLAFDFELDGMPVLWIEAFECLSFRMRVQTTLRRGEEDPCIFDASYSPTGTDLLQVIKRSASSSNLQSRATIPPFQCSRIEKCDPQRTVKPLCKDVDLKLGDITHTVARGVFTLDVDIQGSEAPALVLWEVQDAWPVLAVGKSAKVRMLRQEPLIKTVRVSAITTAGCLVSATSTINIG